MKNVTLLFLTLIFPLVAWSAANLHPKGNPQYTESIPVAGNTWIDHPGDENKPSVRGNSIPDWTSAESTLQTYFRVEMAGSIGLGLLASNPSRGDSRIRVSLGQESIEVVIPSGSDNDTIHVGTFRLPGEGYHRVDIQGLDKSGASFGDIQYVLIGGETLKSGTTFVREDFYWGRRGPSVHLSYTVPEEAGDIEWFYNEVKVPHGEDVIGSFYMACGFAEGYFGFQVNSPTERRILFSVWSPFVTDDPSEIPEDERIVLLGKGEDVYTGEFGNEGSGGQSYLRYNWQAGTTYRFLLRAVPSGEQSTDYSAFFYAPEVGQWQKIASFRRPKTHTHIQRPHSFLENFRTEMGPVSRKALYKNQWVRNTSGQWFELTQARFTADATARRGSRLDYAGGLHESGVFFMQNCGFFNHTTPIDSNFFRPATGQAPQIPFNQLQIP